MYKKTSIIICVYKEPEKFKKMFETLLKHTHKEETPFEITIVNNSELPEFQFHNHNPLSFVDKMQRLAFKHSCNCNIIEMEGNKGVSIGYNVGVKYSSGYYLCFFNSDYYMMDNWLKSMIDCFEHQSNIGLCSCMTNVSGNKDEKQDKFTYDNIFDDYVMKYKDYKESECAIAQMFTTKKIFEEVGGFDENYIASFLDLDFNERIKSKGYKIFVNRKCFGYHDYDNKKPWARQQKEEEYFRNKYGYEKYKWA